jgi:protein-L-isoaspartate(D-aspartate) O-methyltransferase
VLRAAAIAVLLLTPLRASAGPWTKTLEQAGITDPRIFAAFDAVKRADFLPDGEKSKELEDRPLLIGEGQTTSQPSLIALMIQQLQLPRDCRVLEVGTGSGYQTALLARICREVYTVEIVAPLAERAKKRLEELGVKNVRLRVGDGYEGWPDAAPFDGITVGAGAEKVPQPLVKQLTKDGRLVIPTGKRDALELLVVRSDGSFERSIPVRFVPLTGPRADRDRVEVGR